MLTFLTFLKSYGRTYARIQDRLVCTVQLRVRYFSQWVSFDILSEFMMAFWETALILTIVSQRQVFYLLISRLNGWLIERWRSDSHAFSRIAFASTYTNKT
jgi:hypothetical protein